MLFPDKFWESPNVDLAKAIHDELIIHERKGIYKDGIVPDWATKIAEFFDVPTGHPVVISAAWKFVADSAMKELYGA